MALYWPKLPGVVHGPGMDMLAKYGIGRWSKIRCYLASDPITNESAAPQSTDIGRHSEEGSFMLQADITEHPRAAD
jgi:hypothetical protein